jgi:hypothetical protein
VAIGTPAFVTSNSNASGTTLPLTVPAGGVAAGSVLLIYAGAVDTAAVLSSVSDSRGNAYTVDRTRARLTNITASVASGIIVTALQSGDTITLTYTVGSGKGAGAYSVTGLASSSIVDQLAGTDSNSSSVSATMTGATTQADEIIFGAIMVALTPTFTPGSGYTALTEVPFGGSKLCGEHKIVSATGTYAVDATLGTSGQWAAVGATYKAESAVVYPLKSLVTAPLFVYERPQVMFGTRCMSGAGAQAIPAPTVQPEQNPGFITIYHHHYA